VLPPLPPPAPPAWHGQHGGGGTRGVAARAAWPRLRQAGTTVPGGNKGAALVGVAIGRG